MAGYREVLVEVDDFEVLHVKEEWVIEPEYQFRCTKCEYKCKTNGCLQLHQAMNHVPKRYDFVRYVEQCFKITSN